MAGINSVNLVGRLVSKPELKEVKNNKVATFSIAVDRDFTKDETDFFNCQAWNKTAEFMAQYLDKGSLVGIVGRLRQDTWEKDGKKQSRVVITADRVSSLGKKESNKNDNPLADAEDLRIDPSMIPF